MSISQSRFPCEHCGKVLLADRQHAGRQAICPACQQPTKLRIAEEAPISKGIAPATAHAFHSLDNKPGAAPAHDDTSGGQLDFGRPTSVVDNYRRKRRQSNQLLIGTVACALLLTMVVGASYYTWWRKPTLELLAPADRTMQEGETLAVTIGTLPPDVWRGRLRFDLIDAPQGVTLDPQSGELQWQPSEEQGPGAFEIVARATDLEGDLSQQVEFRVAIQEVNQPPVIEPMDDVEIAAGNTLSVTIVAHDPDRPAAGLRYALVEGVRGAQLDASSGVLTWTPGSDHPAETVSFVVAVREARRGGLTDKATFDVTVAATPRPIEKLADALPREELPSLTELPAEQIDEAKALDTAASAAFDTTLLELYRTKGLLQRKRYPELRQLMAQRFAHQFAAEIKAAFAANSELTAWFGKHPVIEEELYTALLPEHDNVSHALVTFAELWKANPTQIERYANLAIALAVTWDQPSEGVVDYERLAKYAHATMPGGMLAAQANFDYFVAQERVMQGRAQFLPWEFLTLLVNHPTPLAERQWALAGYLSKRSMFGKCYQDVPYDYTMLDTRGVQTQLNGRVYSLPNLQAFGGICAYQADFASRVGKSIGVPAAYVSGAGRFGDAHAWVMWVELAQVTATGISFSLESYGRYRGDHYYVGQLDDPQTGEQITDRQLERRLHTAGIDVWAARQAKLAMRCYPELVKLAELDAAERFRLLRGVLELSPGNEAAWIALSKMSAEPEVRQTRKKEMRSVLDSLFLTFSAFPDFTWEVFDDLVAFEEDLEARIKLFQRLEQLYLGAKRPDLAFAARHKITDYLVERGQRMAAIDGLAAAVKAFPDEGQFVPAMLDRIETLCDEVEGTKQQLVQFYMAFLPLIPQTRSGAPSKYCIAMYERGIRRFQEHGYDQAASALQAELIKVTNSRRSP